LKKLEQGEWKGFSCSLDRFEAVTPSLIKQQMMKADAALQALLQQIDLAAPLKNGQSGADVVMQMIKHEMHHHGQLINYLFCHHMPIPSSWHDEWALGYDDAPYQPPRRARMHTAYQATYAAPLVMVKGDEVTVEERSSAWSGWLWATHPDGRSGWTPASFLQRNGEKAIARRDYDAVELTVAVGERLTVVESESSWAWAINGRGRRGWVPVDNLTWLGAA
jgi:hypothetical protein